MPTSDISQEAQRIVQGADSRGIVLRLMGGLAIKFHCPSADNVALRRNYPDIDLVGLKKQSKKIQIFFIELDYKPDEMFNAIRGGSRLMFFDVVNERRVDIFLDIFEMCHRFDLRDRLNIDPVTLSLADLVATKLQVFKANEKDFGDLITILIDHNIGTSDEKEVINGIYISRLCSKDWGVYKTFTRTLQNMLLMLDRFNLSRNEREVVKTRANKLLELIESEPKSVKWKMRSKIGQKVQWYKLPEEIE
jgi:hypothetical protein